MAVSGHKSEASIRSYSHTVSEEQTHNMSASLTVATNDEITDIIPQDSQLCSTSTTQSDVLAGMDFNLPSSQELNHIMNIMFYHQECHLQTFLKEIDLIGVLSI
jgi:hypothetical protein